MFNVLLDYPSFEEEIAIVKGTTGNQINEIDTVISRDEIMYFQQLLRQMPVADNVYEYAVNLVSMTRPQTTKAHQWANEYLSWGAGPRASQYLILGAKARAILQNRYTPNMDDIRALALPVLRHRLVMSYRAEAEGMNVEKIIDYILQKNAV
jgi:MoxR-like ATPase